MVYYTCGSFLIILAGMVHVSVCYNITMDVNAQVLRPGDQLEVTCAVPDMLPADIIQIARTRVDSHFENTMTVRTLGNGAVWEISNSTRVYPALSMVAPRYVVHVVNEYSLMLVVYGVEPEDSGHWTCRLIPANDVTTAYEPPDGSIPISVIGPIYNVAWMEGPSDADLARLGGDGIFHVNAEYPGKMLVCFIQYNNVAPNVTLHWVSGDMRMRLTPYRDYYSHVWQSVTPHFAGLDIYNNTAFYELSRFRDFTVYNGWNLECTVVLQFYEIQNITLSVNITYAPVKQVCVSDAPVYAELGVEDLVLYCEFRANPPPEVSWTPPSDIEGELDYTQVGDAVNSTYTLPSVEEEQFGVYTVRATNMYGTVEVAITLEQVEVVSSSQDLLPCPSLTTVFAIALIIVAYYVY